VSVPLAARCTAPPSGVPHPYQLTYEEPIAYTIHNRRSSLRRNAGREYKHEVAACVLDIKVEPVIYSTPSIDNGRGNSDSPGLHRE
jgi:hypothetical protein